MMPKISFNLSALWGPRRETPAALAQRWLATVRQLRALDPALADWYRGVDGRGVPVLLEPAAIEAAIAAGANDTGFRLTAKSDVAGRGPRVFEFIMSGGDIDYNVVTFGTELLSDPDPSLLRYDLFKPALLAIAEAFAVQRAYAYPRALSKLWPPSGTDSGFPIAWISYVSPHAAPLITPPPKVLVEHRPDGGLLMAATAETFDVGNPAHMEAARDIERAVAPLNGTQPWELEAWLS